MENSKKSTQTTFTVTEDAEDEARVRCLRTCQTITHIDVDEESPDKITALLEYVPYSKIKEDCIKIYDIPKKNILWFDASNLQNIDIVRDSTEHKTSRIKKDDVTHNKRILEKRMENEEVQTNLMVAPHILEDDALPLVSVSLGTQTNTTFKICDTESKTRLAFLTSRDTSGSVNFNEGTSTTKNENDVPAGSTSTDQVSKMSKVSTMKEISTIDATMSSTIRRMRDSVEATAKKLEDQLERMVQECSFGEKTQNRDIQSSTMADHVIPGDCIGYKKPRILCECDCSGGGGGAVPMLGTPEKIVVHARTNRKVDVSVELKSNFKFQSMPDLNEQTIRLPGIGDDRKGRFCRCHCAQSDTTNICAGFMAHKTIKPKTSTKQNDSLLVDEDADYVDEYLELLAHDEIGTQTELADVDDDDSDYSMSSPEKCPCTRNIEMPWDDITYNPLQKRKPEPVQPIVEALVEAVQSPSTVKLKQLTVGPIDDVGFLELTADALADRMADEDFDINQIEQQIIDEARAECPEEEVPEQDKPPRLPPAKPKPHLVYDPGCERHNEPYMDRMYNLFPDDCDAMDRCPSSIEMPWKSILLPKKCNIRKQYKPPPPRNTEGTGCGRCGGRSDHAKPPKNTNSKAALGFDFKFSFSDISSRMFPVENAAQDQVSVNTTVSNVAYKPKRAQKTYTIKGSFSQPYISHKEGTTSNQQGCGKCSCSIKDSDLMRVLNLTDNKCKNVPQKSNNMKPFTSMPSISSKSSVRKTADGSANRANKTDRIACLLESCKKEMEPIKDGINKLRLRIQELNLPDISSYQEIPQRPGGQSAYPGMSFPYVQSYGSLKGTNQMQYVPCWTPYLPYMPPCPMPPCCYPKSTGQSGYQERKPRRARSKKSRPVRTKSSSQTSSGTDYSESEDCTAIHKNMADTCTESSASIPPKEQGTMLQKKVKPSKIPKKINQCDSCKVPTSISDSHKMCHKVSEGTLTNEECHPTDAQAMPCDCYKTPPETQKTICVKDSPEKQIKCCVCREDSPETQKKFCVCTKDSPETHKKNCVCRKDSPETQKKNCVCRKDSPETQKKNCVCRKDSPETQKKNCVCRKDSPETQKKNMVLPKDSPETQTKKCICGKGSPENQKKNENSPKEVTSENKTNTDGQKTCICGKVSKEPNAPNVGETSLEVTYQSPKQKNTNTYTISSKVRIDFTSIANSKYKKTKKDNSSSVHGLEDIADSNIGCTSSQFDQRSLQASESGCLEPRGCK